MGNTSTAHGQSVNLSGSAQTTRLSADRTIGKGRHDKAEPRFFPPDNPDNLKILQMFCEIEASRKSTLKKNDGIDGASSSSNVEGCKDLGADSLENNRASKRSRYLCPDTKILSTGLLNGEKKSLACEQTKCLMNANSVTLPEEILLYIFKMLDKRTLVTCTLVCHQWRRIAYDESLWQQLHIYCHAIRVSTLNDLLARNIKYFSALFSTLYFFTDEDYCTTPFPKLQHLDLSAASIHVVALRSLLRQCSNLIKLSLEGCSVDSLCCQYIGRNTNLKVLNLPLAEDLNRSGLEHIVSLQNLEELNLAWAKLEIDSLQYLMANMIPNLKRLNISRFLNKLNDFDLSRLSSCCSKLIEIDVSDNSNITASGLDKILEKNHKLEVLTMNNCLRIVTPRLLNPTEIIRRKRISIMSLKKVNCNHELHKIFGDEINSLCDLDIPYLDLKISANTYYMFSDNSHLNPHLY